MGEWKGPGPWVRVEESDVLEAITGHGYMATYVVANSLRMRNPERYRHIKTSAVLARLKKLESSGQVRRVTDRRNPYERQLMWELVK